MKSQRTSAIKKGDLLLRINMKVVFFLGRICFFFFSVFRVLIVMQNMKVVFFLGRICFFSFLFFEC